VAELATIDDTAVEVPAQLRPSDGLPERKAVARRRQRVLDLLHTLPPHARDAVAALVDSDACSDSRPRRRYGMTAGRG
jgi:phospholipid/cholesterol/gamma-HCH transport system ATP-binding protein